MSALPTVTPLAIPEVKLLTPVVHRDARGLFLERWNGEWAAAGLPPNFVQINQSRSARGTLRGLHYQLRGSAQAKLVGVASGRILDVAVDLRRGSPTYLQHVAAVLDSERFEQLLVPAGFAHGFLVLSSAANVIYTVDAPYAPAAERGVRWNDPTLAIDWGLEPGAAPLLSSRDAELPLIGGAEHDFVYEERRE